MVPDGLDGVDRGLRYLLQENARSNTTAEIGEKVGVSSSTVGNRIKGLEERGVITGYHPTIDYGKAGLDHHLLVVGTIAFDEVEATVPEVLDVSGVGGVREMLTNRQNVSVEVVGHDREEIGSIPGTRLP